MMPSGSQAKRGSPNCRPVMSLCVGRRLSWWLSWYLGFVLSACDLLCCDDTGRSKTTRIVLFMQKWFKKRALEKQYMLSSRRTPKCDIYMWLMNLNVLQVAFMLSTRFSTAPIFPPHVVSVKALKWNVMKRWALAEMTDTNLDSVCQKRSNSWETINLA